MTPSRASDYHECSCCRLDAQGLPGVPSNICSATESVDVPIEGQILNKKYRLERFLGSGGFASVWAARNIAIDRPVALKILADTLARKPKVVARFLQEARLASRTIHPTVVRVEDIGQTAEQVPYLVMELLEGHTLSEELTDKGPPPVWRSVDIIEHVLTGLDAAHRMGIIHRDIKPANIFVMSPSAADPMVRILDLGLAKDLSDAEGLTQTGALMGTPDYLAPEVLLSADRDRWTAAADVFACGMLAFNLLTGDYPFDHSSASGGGALRFAARAEFYRLTSALPGPIELAAGVPEPIDQVIKTALAIDPAERYPDAGAMLDALRHASNEKGERTDNSSVSARGPAAVIGDTNSTSSESTRRTNPAIWATLGAVGALAVAGLVLTFLGWTEETGGGDNAPGTTLPAEAIDDAEAEEPNNGPAPSPIPTPEAGVAEDASPPADALISAPRATPAARRHPAATPPRQPVVPSRPTKLPAEGEPAAPPSERPPGRYVDD